MPRGVLPRRRAVGSLCGPEDTPIGHVVTSAYLAQTGADLAFENAGGIRGGIPAGDVTAGESSARARHMRGGVARAYRTGWLGADDGEPVGFGDVCDRRGFGRRQRRYGRRLGGCGRRLRLGVACLARYGQCGGVRSGGAACVRGGFKPRCRCRCFAPCPPRALARCELAGSRHADAMSADAGRTLFSALQAFAVSRRPLLLPGALVLRDVVGVLSLSSHLSALIAPRFLLSIFTQYTE